MKNKFFALLVAVVLVIPTIVAVANYMSTANQPANAKNSVRITITDLSGVPHAMERKADGDEADKMIDLICDINSSAKSNRIPALPDAVAAGKYFRVVLSTVSKDDEYHYYMSTDPTLCYISMPDGVICQPDAEDVYAFLGTSFAETLYESATPPKLTVSEEFAVTPVSSDWNYKNYTGAYVKSSAVKADDTAQSFDLTGGLSVKFDNTPDWCSVKVTDLDGNELFNDTSDKLADIRIDSTVKANVEISAKWYEVDDRDYYGESTYAFSATMTPPASFYMPKSETENSRFITISAKNVTDPSKITFKCEPDLGSRPTFYVDGEYANGLLVIPADAVAGEYKITLSCGATTQELLLKVEKKLYTAASVTVDNAVYNSCCSEEALAEFNALVKELAGETSEKRYFEGAFGGFFDDRILYAPISMGYGREITFNDDKTKKTVNNGVDFSVTAGTDVPAVAAGKVVYAGTTAYTGNLVVVEHGYGLKSWYWNMGSIAVAEGDMVEKNASVGTTGSTGFFYGSGAGVHIATSIGETFVCPYQTWYNGDGGVILQGEPGTSAE